MATFQILAGRMKSKNSRLNETILRVFLDENIDGEIVKWIKTRIQGSGIDSDGNQFKTDRSSAGQVYSNFTIINKDKKSGVGGVTDNVTFYDTGRFWSTMKVNPVNGGFEIEMDFGKNGFHIQKNFQRDYKTQRDLELAIMSLSDQEFERLFNTKMNPKLLKKLHGTI